ncbi:hypothetical protein CYY_010083 [Polysphondylium violaceum]|uniref:PNPLA domain-containing protein n=1 Tax=Polysphondylium violaceum TaxID=133409 RepID=A0A8J4PSB8_9MYCE|nr:hypothetical protein CYY_010083 [Polysphondylium violaceum]
MTDTSPVIPTDASKTLEELNSASLEELYEIYDQLVEDQYEQYSKFLSDNNLSFIQTLNQSGANEYTGDTKRGLALSGGGVRGYITVLILEKLQDKLREIKGEPSFDIVDEFDYFGGTSIGGIIALALAHGVKLHELRDLFVKEAGNIFYIPFVDRIPGIGWVTKNGKRFFKGIFDVKPLEQKLQQYFKNEKGEDAYLGEIKTKKPVVVTAAGSDGVPVYFSNLNSSDHKYKIWEVARCTSAAPTYFDPHCFSNDPNPEKPTWYTDGGLFANNPSTVLTAVMSKNSIPLSKIYVLSLGTGQTKTPKPKQLKQLGFSDIITIMDLVMDTTFRSIDLSMKMILAQNYLNINPMLESEIDMADASKIPEMKAQFENDAPRVLKLIQNYIDTFYQLE